MVALFVLGDDTIALAQTIGLIFPPMRTVTGPAALAPRAQSFYRNYWSSIERDRPDVGQISA
jgi:hypothetical protein